MQEYNLYIDRHILHISSIHIKKSNLRIEVQHILSNIQIII